jgi:hypothetical protein
MDELDAIADVEARLVHEGFEEGVAHGRQRGSAAGEPVGREKGLELGAEVGHYRGRVEALLAIYASGSAPSSRILKTLHALRELLAGLSLDPQDQAGFDVLEDVRAKMRVVDLSLGASLHGGASLRPLAGTQAEQLSF